MFWGRKSTKPLRFLLCDLTLHDILKVPIRAHYVLWKTVLTQEMNESANESGPRLPSHADLKWVH